jgi:hypothetical protein
MLPRLLLVLIGVCWVFICYKTWQRQLISGQSLVMVGLIVLALTGVSFVITRRRAARCSWGLCVLLMLCLHIDIGHRQMPALARSRAPLVTSQTFRRLAHSGQAVVACPGQSWGSVTFACRGPILDTDKATTAELMDFLNDYGTAFIVLGKDDFEVLRQYAADTFRFTLVQETATGVLVLTERGLDN